MSWYTLVDCETLSVNLSDASIRIVDARAVVGGERGAGRAAYETAHLPGAQFVDLETDLSDHAIEGQGRHPWPSDADFAVLLQRLGITPDHQVVVYDADVGMYAARFWCMLRLFGHAKVAVLDGGFARWMQLGLPVTSEIKAVERSELRHPGGFDHAKLFDHEDVAAHVESGGLLVDARAAERFRGETEPLDKKAGHVPGAANRPFMANIADGVFKSKADLFAEFHALLAGRTPSDMVAMCGSGVTACHHLLAMAHAGLEGAKLYKGSWSGWIASDERPVETGESTYTGNLEA